MTTASISVLLPVYNGQAYLQGALDSIHAQTLPPCEVIVIDDGSTDRSAEIAESNPGVVLIRQQNAGAAAARNRGIEVASGAYIACLDCDDIAAPERLERQAAAFSGDGDLDLCFSHLQEFISPELSAAERSELSAKDEPVPGACIGTMMVRRDSFLRVGMLDPTLRVAYFMQWYGLAQELGLRFEMLPDVLVRRRLHGDNTGRREKDRLPSEYAQVLRTKIARQRSRQ